MASSGNHQHCANCIGTRSFPMSDDDNNTHKYSVYETYTNVAIIMIIEFTLCSPDVKLQPPRSTTHIRLTALCPQLPGWAGTRKVKPIWILLKQETVSSSGISWTICKSAPCSRQITTPAAHHSVFLQVGRPSFRPTNSVKALKATRSTKTGHNIVEMGILFCMFRFSLASLLTQTGSWWL